MREESFVNDGVEFIKVNKTVANKAFDMNEVIILLPCNAMPNSPWWSNSGIKKKDFEDYIGRPEEQFQKLCDNYKYYNCNSNELGKRIKFFVTRKTLDNLKKESK